MITSVRMIHQTEIQFPSITPLPPLSSHINQHSHRTLPEPGPAMMSCMPVSVMALCWEGERGRVNWRCWRGWGKKVREKTREDTLVAIVHISWPLIATSLLIVLKFLMVAETPSFFSRKLLPESAPAIGAWNVHSGSVSGPGKSKFFIAKVLG